MVLDATNDPNIGEGAPKRSTLIAGQLLNAMAC